jgi:hypothetical protein
MATYTPPPYFPQSSLQPTDPHKYRKFKLIVAAIVLAVVLALAGIVTGVVFLIKWLF